MKYKRFLFYRTEKGWERTKLFRHSLFILFALVLGKVLVLAQSLSLLPILPSIFLLTWIAQQFSYGCHIV